MFPYYVVRFKLLYISAVLLFQQGFHTTQYDLNLPPAPANLVSGAEFPYYIVRFKHILMRRKEWDKTSFHTTQYDLNRTSGAQILQNIQFPYYIVRFKPFRIVALSEYSGKFPYYIVRFKLAKQQHIGYYLSYVSILHSTI